MSDDPHDDLTELESAIHHLKEAQTLHNDEDYKPELQDVAIDKVGEAIDEIEKYLDKETTRIEENTPVPLENE